MDPHHFLDFDFGHNGPSRLRSLLAGGTSPEARAGRFQETLLHVATRRRRPEAIAILLDHGADINARTAGGKTAYAHAIRRGFDDVVELLTARGADTSLNEADRLAVAVVSGRLDEAAGILRANSSLARTGNPEEDRLLADIAGRNAQAPVELLIAAGADLTAPGLDGGTPLHQAAWFGQPVNAKLLVDAGAPLDVFDETHDSSPLHWAIHGSRYSGGATERADVYAELVTMLLDAGSSLYYPDDEASDAYKQRMLTDASPQVREILRARL